MTTILQILVACASIAGLSAFLAFAIFLTFPAVFMSRLRVSIGRLSLHYDKGYGTNKVRGWSVSWYGCFLVTFVPGLGAALWMAWRELRKFKS